MQNRVPLDVRAFHPRLALRTSTPLPGKSADVSDEAVLLQVSLRRETERVMLSPKQTMQLSLELSNTNSCFAVFV